MSLAHKGGGAEVVSPNLPWLGSGWPSGRPWKPIKLLRESSEANRPSWASQEPQRPLQRLSFPARRASPFPYPCTPAQGQVTGQAPSAAPSSWRRSLGSRKADHASHGKPLGSALRLASASYGGALMTGDIFEASGLPALLPIPPKPLKKARRTSLAALAAAGRVGGAPALGQPCGIASAWAGTSRRHLPNILLSVSPTVQRGFCPRTQSGLRFLDHSGSSSIGCTGTRVDGD